MTRVVLLADMVSPNDPGKRTFRQINAALQHAIPLEALVELNSGARLFVVAHERDCDMTPLYALALTPDTPPDAYAYGQVMHGYAEESLTVVVPGTDGLT